MPTVDELKALLDVSEKIYETNAAHFRQIKADCNKIETAISNLHAKSLVSTGQDDATLILNGTNEERWQSWFHQELRKLNISLASASAAREEHRNILAKSFGRCQVLKELIKRAV